MRRWLLCVAAVLACRPAAGTTAPGPTTVDPPPVRAPQPEPEPRDDVVETTAAAPVVTAHHVEEGWVRNPDDPSAPVAQLDRADDYGPTGAAVVQAIVDSASEILSCWEVAVAGGAKRGSVGIVVRAPSDPDDDLMVVNVAQDADAEVQRCIDTAVRKRLPMPAKGDVASVGFRFFSRRDEVVMQTVDPGGIVAVRAGGSCFQWREEGPCPPNKHCYASRWIRTRCGPPAMRDDVSVRFGLGTPKGDRASLIDARLVAGDGTVLWLTALPSAFVVGYGDVHEVAKGPSVAAAPSAFAVTFARETVTVADAVGVQIFGRTDGKARLSWVAPERAQPTLWFDDGEYTIRRGATTCQGDARHGSWYAECGDRR
ncbi:MAG: hypothetical protein AAF721_24790, partial [Myxococcota bacterium]